MTKRNRERYVVGVGALAALVLLATGAHAQDPPVLVRVSPSQAQVEVGGTVDVAAQVVEVQNLYGVDITLLFDPAVVEVVDADPSLPGVQVSQGTFLDPGFAVINVADNTQGIAHLVMTQLNPSQPKSGTGTLAVVRLRGKQVSAGSPLVLQNPQLARPDGLMIPMISEPGQLEVVQVGGGQTSTPMPTQGAGTPMPTSADLTPFAPTVTEVTASVTPMQTATPLATVTSEPTGTPKPTVTADNPGAEPVSTIAPGVSVPPATRAPLTLTGNVLPSDTAQPGVTVVAQADLGGAGRSDSKSTSVGARTALIIAIGAAALAAVLGAVLGITLLTRRRSKASNHDDQT